ncbi:MAG: ATP-binding protein [Spirochaetes bacterium]|jgi:predicted AAA+ superfamily ATPase|nr:ATP-binding protein [Spirochaetota bacterium]
MYISRNIKNQVQLYLNLFPVILLTGPRQTGKTTFLLNQLSEYKYVTLDDPAEAERAVNMPQQFLDSLSVPVIIDEVQYAPELFRYIKTAVDANKKPGSYVLTGSQQFNIMHNVAESLAGRCGVLNMLTLSFEEASSKIKISLPEYLIQGGYPALYSDTLMKAAYWFPSYVNTYLERDVRNIINIHNLRDFNRFMRALALRSGQILSLSDLARDVGIAPNTAKAWLSTVESSGIVKLLEPYFFNSGKRLVKSPKVYFTDTGLLCHLVGINSYSELLASPLSGAVWETYAFCQIYHAFLKEGKINPPLWFWRDRTGNEVDFVIEKGGRYILFEAKLTEKPSKKESKGFAKFEAYYGEGSVIRSSIIAPVNKPFPLKDGIIVDNGRIVVID